MIKNILKKLSPSLYYILSNAYNRVFRMDKNFFKKMFANNQNYKSININTGLTVGEFDGNKYLIKCRPSNLIETNIYRNSNWETYLLNIMSSELGIEKEIVLDIGANMGAISIPLSKKHKNIEFHCFEPNPFVFKDLEFNISINSVQNLTAIMSVVSNSKENQVNFYAQSNSTNMGLSSTKLNKDIDEHIKILANNTTIDNYTSNLKNRIAVIKIDTQGNELSVIKSAEETIRKNRPTIFFEVEDEYFKTKEEKINNKKNILEFFNMVNYELYYLNNKRYFPLITFKDYFHGDVIAVPVQKKD